jgi:hypothetical protein
MLSGETKLKDSSEMLEALLIQRNYLISVWYRSNLEYILSSTHFHNAVSSELRAVSSTDDSNVTNDKLVITEHRCTYSRISSVARAKNRACSWIFRIIR